MGWGSVAQVTDPQYAAGKFFSALKGVGNRDGLSLTRAAQAVQRSAFPDAYAKHEEGARNLLASLGGGAAATLGDPFGGFYGDQGTQTKPAVRNILGDVGGMEDAEALKGVQGIASETPFGLETANLGMGLEGAKPAGGMEDPDPAAGVFPSQRQADPFAQIDPEAYKMAASGGVSGQAGDIIAKAKQFLGTPYVWGGASALGMDCSGLNTLVFKQFGINLPHLSYMQAQMGQGTDEPKPGDLFFEDWSSRNNGKGGGGADHTGIYIGNGKVIEANRRTGQVQISNVRGRMWFRSIL